MLPVEAHTTDFAPSDTARDIAETMPRSLKEPVGFMPSTLTWTSAPTVRERVGEDALVLDRTQVLEAGLLGPVGLDVPAHVQGRLGDAIVLSRGRTVVDDSRRHPPDRRPEIGVHGSLTAAESLVPLLTLEA